MPPSSVLSTINRSPTVNNLDHLILVPCHAIWVGTKSSAYMDEVNWILEPYQRGGNRIAAFLEHIKQGANIALKDDHSLLIFSGGQTRLKSTSSEAESYLRLALHSDVFHSASENHFERATTEDYALDSYQNLLFSIARFREFTGRFPMKITVVGYEFKKARFTDLHRAAIRWPLHSFHYVGVDPDANHSKNAEEGERKNGYLPYSVDKYGCHSLLLAKRRQRNPYARFHPYYVSSPELVPLLDWCPNIDEQGSISGSFRGALPWDTQYI
ncbi:hypothetical protein BDQ12DRAFT_730541 [Crucibulum laeve]|uniref:DUF218 domain-containing protein n=1 Tax=Crucibulum laeve TaxID=68775 RepID=A0A5C3MIH3_9AGAR|nr:hypothetical protein BDQ12DRAFT_730541 [Crucibulum laeve]